MEAINQFTRTATEPLNQMASREMLMLLVDQDSVKLPILLSGYLYYFDIAPVSMLLDAKSCKPVRNGCVDLDLAKATIRCTKAHGWVTYDNRHLITPQSLALQSLAPHRRA
ncbi:hypothetical protein F4677DRAFT_444949 [Hypoxylon crocopeplum]|nr:hypothetical protein F4677DRAFT_444949 [Hypoxylon crocopeplum]